MTQQQVIVDDKGEFFVNKGVFPFVDPTNGVRFEPDTPVKVVQTAWMKGQPVIQKVVPEKPSK
jgi:hypothetical protein